MTINDFYHLVGAVANICHDTSQPAAAIITIIITINIIIIVFVTIIFVIVLIIRNWTFLRRPPADNVSKTAKS